MAIYRADTRYRERIVAAKLFPALPGVICHRPRPFNLLSFIREFQNSVFTPSEEATVIQHLNSGPGSVSTSVQTIV